MNDRGGDRLSLVLAVYNGEQTLERALASVFAQSYPLDEVVIVNDGSSDATSQIIARWNERLPITCLVNERNIGFLQALQRGIGAATGNVVFRLDADDEWFPHHVATIMGLRRNTPDAILYTCRAEIRNLVSGATRLSDALEDTTIRARLMWDNPLVHSATAFDKRAFDAVGGYQQAHYALDYDLWVRLLRDGKLAVSNTATVAYFVLPTSLSRISKRKALRIRLGIQLLAVRTFCRRHPLIAILILPITLARQLINTYPWHATH